MADKKEMLVEAQAIIEQHGGGIRAREVLVLDEIEDDPGLVLVLEVSMDAMRDDAGLRNLSRELGAIHGVSRVMIQLAP